MLKNLRFQFNLKTLPLALLTLTACTAGDAKNALPIIEKDPEKPGVAAKIGDQEISMEALIGSAKQQYYDIQKQEYEFKLDRFQKFLEEKLIGEAAKKAGLSMEQYLTKNVYQGIKVSDSDVSKFLKSRDYPEDQVKQNPELKQQVVEYLENDRKKDKLKEHLAKLSKGQKLEVFFKKPGAPRTVVEIGDAPIEGAKDAKVQIVAFSDFQCPYCSKGADTIQKVKDKYGKKVGISFKHFPLPFHPQATPASEISMCVNKLGGGSKFWKFHDLVFKNQKQMETDKLISYAKDAGVDEAKVKTCFEAKEFKGFVENDLEYGRKIGVGSTPTFFINGRLVAGALPIEQFSEIIDEELSVKK